MRWRPTYAPYWRRKGYVDEPGKPGLPSRPALMPYPWQLKQWEQVRLAADRNMLAHALLLSGAEGTGMGQFALELSRYLLCDTPARGAACDECRSCILFTAGNHPDIRLIGPEDNGSQIKVDAIRDMIAYLQLSNQYGRRKIAVIEPAEGMNRHAANSLLKTLEEPAPSTLLVLVTHQPSRLPVTVRSRCRLISFNHTDRESASRWLRKRINDPARTDALLELAADAPLKALDLHETGALQLREEMLDDLREAGLPHADPAGIAQKWQKHDAAEVMSRLLFLFSRMAVLRAVKAGASARQGVFEGKLGRVAGELPLPRLLDCYDLSLRNYHFLTGETNLNKQGLLEEIIVYWQSIHRNKSADDADERR